MYTIIRDHRPTNGVTEKDRHASGSLILLLILSSSSPPPSLLSPLCRVFIICAIRNFILPMKYVLYFYISTSRSMCAVPNMAVFCSSLISCVPTILLTYCLSDFDLLLLLLILHCLLSQVCSSWYSS